MGYWAIFERVYKARTRKQKSNERKARFVLFITFCSKASPKQTTGERTRYLHLLLLHLRMKKLSFNHWITTYILHETVNADPRGERSAQRACSLLNQYWIVWYVLLFFVHFLIRTKCKNRKPALVQSGYRNFLKILQYT